MSTAAGIYARELFSLGYGYPMWCPEPCPREIRLGDVGYLRDGQFHILFNTMPSTRAPGDAVTAESSEETTNVPEVYPPNFVEFVPPRETIVHASKRLIQPSASAGLDTPAAASGSLGLNFKSTRESGALLLLDRPGHKTSLSCDLHIRQYISEHIGSWCEYANTYLGIGLEDNDIMFVSGFFKTPVWTMAAFHDTNASGELTIRAGSFPFASSELRVSRTKDSTGLVFTQAGPYDRLQQYRTTGELEEKYDQCIFLNYYKSKRRILRTPKIIRAAAGRHRLPEDTSDSDDGSDDRNSVSSDESIDQFTQYYDPVNQLLGYILKVAHLCHCCALLVLMSQM
ncbi:hypothetical protein C8Q76DRAFT_688166 [Earliella scabrosa]|nr:hypothetical protein C8Q76DRAFT_688166 [Earliella scabrosa]